MNTLSIRRFTVLLVGAMSALSSATLSPPAVATIFADTCTDAGGTATCVAALVGPYNYQVGYAGGSGQGATESSAIAAFQQYLLTNNSACTATYVDMRPPWQPAPVGNGHAQSGSQSGASQFWSIDWRESTESGATTYPLNW